jgi:hypothetical protein
VSAAIVATSFASCRALPDHSALDDKAAREFVREQALAVKDLAASVDLSIATDDFDGSLGGALLVEPPSRLRLRATKFTTDVFDLVVTPDELDLFWFRDRTFFRRRLGAGAAAAVGAARSVDPGRGERSPDAFLASLDGAALRLALAAFEVPVLHESVAREDGSLVVRARLADGGELVRRFDGKTLFLENVELAASDGTPRLQASYGRYRRVEPAEHWLPHRMELRDLASRSTFTMTFDDVAVNEGVLPGAFTLAPPPGVEVREVER